jgi:hypothetical protein
MQEPWAVRSTLPCASESLQLRAFTPRRWTFVPPTSLTCFCYISSVVPQMFLKCASNVVPQMLSLKCYSSNVVPQLEVFSYTSKCSPLCTYNLKPNPLVILHGTDGTYTRIYYDSNCFWVFSCFSKNGWLFWTQQLNDQGVALKISGRYARVPPPHVWYPLHMCDILSACVVSSPHLWFPLRVCDLLSACVIPSPHIWFALCTQWLPLLVCDSLALHMYNSLFSFVIPSPRV